MKTIDLPVTITSIGGRAFLNSQIQSISLPSRVSYIEESAFSNSHLCSIDFPSGPISLDDCVFAGTKFTEIYIPDNVVKLGGNAFYYCENLRSVRLPNISSFDGNEFYGCTSLNTIIWPECGFGISSGMFSNCGLTEVTIPERVHMIGDNAFANNPLKKITIPDNTYYDSSLASSFVDGCTELEEIKCCCVIVPALNSYAFNGVSRFNCKLIVPEECLTKYQNAEGWNKFINIETFSIPATSIGFNKDLYIVAEGTTFDDYCFFHISSTPRNATNRYNSQIFIDDTSISNYSKVWDDAWALSGNSIGETTITVTLGELTGTARIKVVDRYNIYSMNFTESIVEIEQNERKWINVSVLPESAIFYNSYIWSSSDENVVTTPNPSNSYGCNIMGVSPGTATLTVTASDGKTASCTVVVGGAQLPDEKYGSAPNELTFRYGALTSEDPENYVGKTSMGTWVANNIHITDRHEVVNPYELIANTLTYTRTFNSTNWQGLYVPFAMEYDEWKDDAIIAELAGIHMYDDNGDGTPDRTNVEFASVKEGSILSNVPYLIKPLHTGTVDFVCTNRTLYPTQGVNGSVYSCTPRWKYSLIGTYVNREGLIGDGIYSLGDGVFRHNDSDIPPLRFYLEMTRQSGGYWGAPGINQYPSEMEISIDGQAVSGIEDVSIDYDFNAAENTYYDLMGRKVERPTSGIYLHNNKLILIK